jgi:radical SAM protein with 4Fe4S-binding SPASM domain
LKTKINVTQLCLDDSERQRKWEEERRFPLHYFQNRFQWYKYPKWHYVASFPLHVDFEVSSRCNLSCPMCFRRNFENDQDFMDMDFDLFQKGVEECALNELYSIRLSWRGESTLHPKLPDMIRFAREVGIKEISFLSNGSALNREFSMGLIESGLDYITISVDALRENYNQLRQPLDFDQTVSKIAELFRLKEKYGKGFPKVKVQGIYEYFKRQVREYYETFKSISDNVSFNVKHDYTLKTVDQEDNLYCPYLWQRITITPSGLIPLCISDWNLDLSIGNLRENTIKDVWKGSLMGNFRKIHTENRRLELKPCRQCIRTKTATIEEVI